MSKIDCLLLRTKKDVKYPCIIVYIWVEIITSHNKVSKLATLVIMCYNKSKILSLQVITNC